MFNLQKAEALYLVIESRECFLEIKSAYNDVSFAGSETSVCVSMHAFKSSFPKEPCFDFAMIHKSIIELYGNESYDIIIELSTI